MLEISLQATHLDDLDERMKRAISRKMTQLTNLMYQKVIDNLSGKILQTKSGQLVGSVYKQRDRMSGGVITGHVGIEPETPKAWALEKGGRDFYPITPKSASVLKFYWDKVGETVYLHYVNHPPSRQFGYLSDALEEMRPEVPSRFSDLVAMINAGEGEE